MPSLLTAEQKAVIQAAFQDVHDTFARDIYVYVETKVASANINSDFNPLYGYRKNSNQLNAQKTVLTKYTYKARVFYDNKQNDNVLDAGSQINLSSSKGRVKITVKEDAFEKLKICSRVEVDGELYILDSDEKNVGPFDTQFYSIYLKREN